MLIRRQLIPSVSHKGRVNTYARYLCQMVWACVINENDENGNPKLTVVGTDKATYTKQ